MSESRPHEKARRQREGERDATRERKKQTPERDATRRERKPMSDEE